jgi:hypothetical protein
MQLLNVSVIPFALCIFYIVCLQILVSSEQENRFHNSEYSYSFLPFIQTACTVVFNCVFLSTAAVEGLPCGCMLPVQSHCHARGCDDRDTLCT